MKVKENRTGKLENDQDFQLAFRKLISDFNTLVRAFNELQERVEKLEAP